MLNAESKSVVQPTGLMAKITAILNLKWPLTGRFDFCNSHLSFVTAFPFLSPPDLICSERIVEKEVNVKAGLVSLTSCQSPQAS